MRIQTLVTALNKSDEEILKLVQINNLHGEIIVGSQCGRDGIKKYKINESDTVTILHLCTVGVSKNRNSLLSYSSADIITFADDDMVFTQNYLSIVLEEFSKNKKVDSIRFNCESSCTKRPIKQLNKSKRLRFIDVRSLGAWGVFFKRNSIITSGILFDENIGPGTKINHGEDGVFLHDYLKSHSMIQIPSEIAVLRQDESSWWGKDIPHDVYSHGYIYRCLFGCKSSILGTFFILKHRFSLYSGLPLSSLFKWFHEGISDAKKAEADAKTRDKNSIRSK